MSKVIVFGLKDFAELAWYYLTNDSPHEVVAFCVNEFYMPENSTFKGLPVLAFESITEIFSPNEYVFFAPISPSKMNTLRENIYNDIKSKGYSTISYVSSKVTVFNSIIGDNCFILENNTLQPFTEIGNNVILWSGNHIGHHSIIKDHVFLASQVVLSGHCVVEPYCYFGVNSTIRDGLSIAEGTFVAMNDAVTKKTEPWGVYDGNPAAKRRISSKELKF